MNGKTILNDNISFLFLFILVQIRISCHTTRFRNICLGCFFWRPSHVCSWVSIKCWKFSLKVSLWSCLRSTIFLFDDSICFYRVKQIKSSFYSLSKVSSLHHLSFLDLSIHYPKDIQFNIYNDWFWLLPLMYS